VLTYFLTPTFVLFVQNPNWIPETFQFIMLKENTNIPVIWQFLILELAIDGLRLAAVNTPSMLSTPLSIMAGLVLGEFSVKSGWFNAEVMLYMAFVAIANYTQSNYELGYALKFMRIITLVLTGLFDLPGYIAGVIIFILSILTNRTIANHSYAYPLFPFNGKELIKRMIRFREPRAKE
jgi:stage V sporulation protein AF